MHVNTKGNPAVAVGAVVLDVTATVVVEVQPFAGFVTVTVYVFAAFTVAVEVAAPAVIPAPVQLNVAPGVNELAVIFPLNVVHVNTKGNPAVAVGGVVFIVTATVVVAVHPFAGFVTVTVYVFAAFTVAVEVAAPAVIPAPVQLNVAPGVNELAVMFPLNVVHVNTKGNPAVAAGGVVFAVTATVDVFVQPVIASVAVTVYVPVAVTTAGLGLFNGNEPPFHTIVFPILVPVKVEFKFVHVILLLLIAETVGGVVLDVIVTELVPVQPPPSVTITE